MLDQINWVYYLQNCPDVGDMCMKFTNKFLEIAKQCTPNRTVTIRPNDKPWFDTALRREMRNRDRLKKQFRKSQKPSILQQYKKTKNKVNNMKKNTLNRYIIPVWKKILARYKT